MKPAKFIVLVGGLLGLIGFFVPMLKASVEGKDVSVSAMQVMTGVSVAKDAVGKVQTEVRDDVATKGGEKAGDNAQMQKGLKDIDDMLDKIKIFVLILFAPSVLFLLIGGIGAARKKFGRVGGVFALLIGLLGTGMWALVNAAVNEVAKDNTSGGSIAAGIGLWLLLAAGAAGIIGGILVLIKPDDGQRGAGSFGR